MLDDIIKGYVIGVSELLNIEECVIEKDYYVTQVIHLLSTVENEYFRLIFCGGTCLAKAHKLVNRMSEDVDFKIQLKDGYQLTRSRLIKELKAFREQIKSSLNIPDISISDSVARNEGKYQRVILSYPQLFPVNQALRPDMMLEFTYSNIRCPIDNCQIKTIIEDYVEAITLFDPPETKCVSIIETAAEKWVALTRRIMAIERGYESDDKTLIRHVYDLCAIKDINQVDTSLVNEIIEQDKNVFKNQHVEYMQDPDQEIRKSLNLLKSSKLWEERYHDFMETMVYDLDDSLTYKDSVERLEQIYDGFHQLQ